MDLSVFEFALLDSQVCSIGIILQVSDCKYANKSLHHCITFIVNYCFGEG